MRHTTGRFSSSWAVSRGRDVPVPADVLGDRQTRYGAALAFCLSGLECGTLPDVSHQASFPSQERSPVASLIGPVTEFLTGSRPWALAWPLSPMTLQLAPPFTCDDGLPTTLPTSLEGQPCVPRDHSFVCPEHQLQRG